MKAQSYLPAAELHLPVHCGLRVHPNIFINEKTFIVHVKAVPLIISETSERHIYIYDHDKATTSDTAYRIHRDHRKRRSGPGRESDILKDDED